MRCSLKTCNNTIPSGRKKTARYCSDLCYYEAKRERSRSRYARIKAPADELKSHEGILTYFYGIQQLNKPVTVADLQKFQFNFGISSGEHLDKTRGICKVIGKYAYHIEPSQNVIIWKLK